MFTAKHKASGRYSVVDEAGNYIDFLGTKAEAEAEAKRLNANDQTLEDQLATELDNKSFEGVVLDDLTSANDAQFSDEAIPTEVNSTLVDKSGIGENKVAESSARARFKLTANGWEQN